MIGPNGAGKTTLFNMIAGGMAPDQGRIIFDANRPTAFRADEVCRRGIGRTFQLVRPFPGAERGGQRDYWRAAARRNVSMARERARALLRRFDLFDRRHRPASALTLPDRKRLEVVRALATEPKLLLLDEVVAGLRPTETDRLVTILKELNRETGLTHPDDRARDARGDGAGVPRAGARPRHRHRRGTPDEVVHNPAVIQSYLGAEAV